MGDVAAVEVQQRQVPPIVIGKAALRRPVLRVVGKPRNAGFEIAAHFVDVRHRVHGPAVARIGFHGLAAVDVGAGVVAAFFEAERGHALDVAVAVLAAS